MKVLASDFDGTLFFKGQFKSDDLKQIRMFQKQGHLFGLCTGRPLSGVAAPIQGRLRCDFMILSSGALILDRAGRTKKLIFIIRPVKGPSVKGSRMVRFRLPLRF